MKSIKVIALGLLLALWGIPPLSYAINGTKTLTADGGQTATGNSSFVAVPGLSIPVACKATVTGTAAVYHLECQNGSEAWEDISGSESTGSKQFTIWSACTNIRSEVTTCTSCNVKVYCEWRAN